MDWETGQLLVVPALTVLFQAFKKIVAVGENNQYIPLAAVVSGVAMTVLWTVALGVTSSAIIAEAILRGMVFGAAAVGLYELFK